MFVSVDSSYNTYNMYLLGTHCPQLYLVFLKYIHIKMYHIFIGLIELKMNKYKNFCLKV